MALTEESTIESAVVVGYGIIEVQRRDSILDDGVETSFSFHRHCLSPGDDLTGQDASVTTLANSTWTQGVIDAYNAEYNPAITLPQAKVSRITVMKAAYDAAIAAGFTTNSILMQADIGRLERLKAGYDLAILESEATMDIIDQANVLHAGVAVATVLTMIRALGVNARTLLMQKNARRTSINAAADVAAVNAIDW